MTTNFPEIDKLDLSNIKEKAKVKNGWSDAQADTVESHYRGFLLLHLMHPGKDIVPTEAIDELWHTHILDTKKYMADCDNIFGAYLHHIPSYGTEDVAPESLENQFSDTRRLFMDELGIDITSANATCGGQTSCRSSFTAATCGGQTRCRSSAPVSAANEAATCGGQTRCRSSAPALAA